MSLYVIAQQHEDGFLLLSTEGGVLAFEGQQAAEDYADTLDEPGEFVALSYEDSMGPAWVVV